jgi:hypothetical protein
MSFLSSLNTIASNLANLATNKKAELETEATSVITSETPALATALATALAGAGYPVPEEIVATLLSAELTTLKTELFAKLS